ncbi:MAG: hypothetical protein DRR16_15605 [Candidatus Parabeggiatoa sp. nov. 3]|nr:MAG: hypothetical protein DRQ99_31245 [Gammaproteobacteria bacterium]RKZ84112.1 MAG: hypothetical protein DRR16_15605 [Gammaproteobacteria bacterium]
MLRTQILFFDKKLAQKLICQICSASRLNARFALQSKSTQLILIHNLLTDVTHSTSVSIQTLKNLNFYF